MAVKENKFSLKDTLPYVLFFLSAVIFFARVIFFDRFAYCASELLTTYIPNYVFMSDSWRSGVIPLWHPYHYFSFVGVAFPGVFYPFNILLSLLLDPQGSINNYYNAVLFLEMLHYFMASVFMYLLARWMSLNKAASFFSAVAFAYSTYLVGPLDNPCFVFAMAYYPLLFLLFSRGLQERTVYGVFSGAVLGLMFLTGYPPVAVYSSLSLILYFLFKVSTCQPQERVNVFLRGARCLGLTFVFGGMLAAAQFIPTFEYAKFTIRMKQTYDSITSWGSIPVFHLVTFFMPYFFGGGTAHPQIWIDKVVEIPYNGLLYYVGVLTLLLALFSVFLFRDKRARFFSLLFLVSLLLILGKNSAFFGIAYAMLRLPLVRMPIKFGLFVTFSLCLMAGFGLDRLMSLSQEEAANIKKYLKKIAFILGAFSLISGLTFILLNFIRQEYMQYAACVAIEAIIRCVITFAVVCWAIFFYLKKRTPASLILLMTAGILDIFIVSWQINPVDKVYVPDETFRNNRIINYIRQDKDVFRVSGLDLPVALAGDIAGIQHLGYTGGFCLDRFLKFRGVLNISNQDERSNVMALGIGGHSWFDLPQDPSSQLIDLYNVKYFIFSKDEYREKYPDRKEIDLDEYGGKFRKVQGFDDLYENTRAFPRVFSVHSVRSFKGDDPDQILEMMQTMDLSREAVVEAHAQALEAESLGDSVSLEFYSPRLVKIKADMKSNGMIILSDVWYPGWNVYVDGRKDRILRADYIFRGVLCGPGTHEIVFKYEPLSAKIGMFISVFSAAIALACLVHFHIKKG